MLFAAGASPASAVALESLEIAHHGLTMTTIGGTIDVGVVVDAVVGFFK